MHNLFARPKVNPKRTKERRVRGRVRLKGGAMTDLRWFVYRRADGQCERERKTGKPHHPHCPVFVNWNEGHLAHVDHGSRKTDTPEGTYWASALCHSVEDHNPKSVPRKPGRLMNQTEALAYWKGMACFCGDIKRECSSFCLQCLNRLDPQLQYDVQNATGEDYLRAMALAEQELLAWKPAEEQAS